MLSDSKGAADGFSVRDHPRPVTLLRIARSVIRGCSENLQGRYGHQSWHPSSEKQAAGSDRLIAKALFQESYTGWIRGIGDDRQSSAHSCACHKAVVGLVGDTGYQRTQISERALSVTAVNAVAP